MYVRTDGDGERYVRTMPEHIRRINVRKYVCQFFLCCIRSTSSDTATIVVGSLQSLAAEGSVPTQARNRVAYLRQGRNNSFSFAYSEVVASNCQFLLYAIVYSLVPCVSIVMNLAVRRKLRWKKILHSDCSGSRKLSLECHRRQEHSFAILSCGRKCFMDGNAKPPIER